MQHFIFFKSGASESKYKLQTGFPTYSMPD